MAPGVAVVNGPDMDVAMEAAATPGTDLGARVLRKRKPPPARTASSSDSSSSSSSSNESDDGNESDSSSYTISNRGGRGNRDRDEADASDVSDLEEEEEVDHEREQEAGVYKDLETTVEPAPFDPTYPGDWSGAPSVGSKGFNTFAAGVMQAAGVASKGLHVALDKSAACPPLQPHQEAVAFLLHPQSPVQRLLIDHPTGSGKTREMIRVLDNYFQDPRPKVPIFPKEPVCRNFYLELLRWPSQYRDFFACLRPQDAARAAGTRDWRTRRANMWDLSELPDARLREMCVTVRDVLEMKGWFFMGRMRRSIRAAFQQRFPDEKLPAAPLRALRYTSAGGQHTELRNGLPVSALLKVAFNTQDKNVYSGKIVIMDEAHNLVRAQTQYGAQLDRLRELLSGARGTVLAGFTGTPILNEPQEGRQLLAVIKGLSMARGSNEGFLSSFPMRPQPLFPLALPLGVPDEILTANLRRKFVRRVVLKGEPLKRYDAKRRKGALERSLRCYCNLSVHFGSMHEGPNSCKARVLANMAACAPKLDAIAQDVVAHREKALILIDRRSGLEALLTHLKTVAANASPEFAVATMDEIAAFNAASNRHGERYRVLVADAATCSEGVSFFAVRRLHLADVPAAPSAFIQAVGRAIRMYGHAGLPEEDRTVTTILHVAGLPRWMRSTLGTWSFRAQRKALDPETMQSGGKRLLRRLMAAGIKDLEGLKQRLDACSKRPPLPASSGGGKAQLTGDELAGFFEQIGFWEEAKALRNKFKGPHTSKSDRHRAAARGGREAAAAPAQRPAAAAHHKKVPRQAAQATGGAPRALAPALSRQGSDESTITLASMASLAAARRQTPPAGAAASGEAAQQQQAAPGALSIDLPWQRDPLARALLELHRASTAREAVIRMNLSTETADEEALRQLAQSSRKIVPALAELRQEAIDRTVLLRNLGRPQRPDGSDGESSVHEFGVSASSGNEAEAKAKKVPLVLPPGWRTATFRRGNKEVREIVDPSGKRYRTMALAKKAVDAIRGAENMAESLRAKYRAMLAKEKERAENSAVPRPEATATARASTPPPTRVKAVDGDSESNSESKVSRERAHGGPVRGVSSGGKPVDPGCSPEKEQDGEAATELNKHAAVA